jgi:microcompartment protein CcmK/EutM
MHAAANKMEKVLVCHGTGSASNPWVQICVAPSAVPAQLGNGSYLGACSGSTARTAPKEETPAVKATVLAYPNPSRGIVQVRLTGMTGKVQLSVVDGNGKTHSVREVTVRYSQEDVTLDLQTAASGIYTIRASNGVNLVSTRVVIAR